MDDLQVGARLRAARIRRGWRQQDVAAAAGISDPTVSRIERGHLDGIALGVIRGVAAALEVRLELLPRSRAADLDRLVSARHAALGEAVAAGFARLPSWAVRPEVSFGVYGERGVVDLLAWHAATRSLLVIELKTEIVDVGELLGTLDRKRRLGPVIARSLGWDPATVSSWLIVGEGMTNRRRIAAHATVFRAALPDRGALVRRWLRRPTGEVHGIAFVPDRRPGTTRSGFATPRRVRTRRAGSKPGAARRR